MARVLPQEDRQVCDERRKDGFQLEGDGRTAACGSRARVANRANDHYAGSGGQGDGFWHSVPVAGGAHGLSTGTSFGLQGDSARRIAGSEEDAQQPERDVTECHDCGDDATGVFYRDYGSMKVHLCFWCYGESEDHVIGTKECSACGDDASHKVIRDHEGVIYICANCLDWQIDEAIPVGDKLNGDDDEAHQEWVTRREVITDSFWADSQRYYI